MFWSILALGAIEKNLNRLINTDMIARMQLNALQGKMLRVIIDSPQLSIDTFFDQDLIRLEPTALGQAEKPSIFEQRPFDATENITQATATLHVKTAVQLCQLLLASDAQIGTIPLQGDYKLLFSLKEIMSQLDFDFGAKLSPWIGASLAHEIDKLKHASKQLLRTGKSAEFMLSDYLKEDSGLFAPRWQINTLQQQQRQLTQDIDRLEAKLLQLQQRVQAKHS